MEINDYIIAGGNWTGIILLIVGIMVMLGVGIFLIVWLLKHNKRVIIRKLTGGGNVLIHAKWAREYTDKKSGAVYWKIRGIKMPIPRPIPKAIAIAKGGKEWVDMYDVGQGQFVPAMTAEPDFVESKEFVKTFQPITAQQRASYTDQIEKSYAYKSKGFTELLRDAIPYLALIMIIAVFLLFLSEGMTPILEQARIANKGASDFKIAAEIMREAVQNLRGVQVIGSGAGNFTPPN